MDLDWQDATLPPQPTRAERSSKRLDDAYQRQLMKQQAKRDVAAESEQAPALRALSAALSSARAEMILPSGSRLSPEQKAHKSDLAARQREILHDHRRAVAAAVLAGQIDPQTAQAAGKLISDCVTDLQWFAERLDREQWGERSPPPQEAPQLAIPAGELLKAAMSIAQQAGLLGQLAALMPAGAIEGEARRVPVVIEDKTEP